MICFLISFLFLVKLVSADVYIPRKPYDVYNLVLMLHDINPTYDVTSLETFISTMENYTGYVENGRTWNNFRFSIFVMPHSLTGDCGSAACLWLNSTDGEELQSISNLHGWHNNGSTEFGYHPQCAHNSALDLNETEEYNRILNDLEEFYNAYGYNFTSVVYGWLAWDWHTLINMQKVNVFVDAGTSWNAGSPANDLRGAPLFGYAYWDKIINKTDSVDGLVTPRPTGTLNFNERNDTNVYVVHIPNYDDLGATSSSSIENQITNSISNGEEVYAGYDHIYVSGWVSRFEDVSKWFWDTYAKYGNGRFGTLSEVGYQALANVTVQQSILVNNSTHIIYNLSSIIPKIYWFSIAIPKDEIGYRNEQFKVSHDGGATWSPIEPTRITDEYYWFEVNIGSDVLISAEGLGRPKIIIQSPENITYQSQLSTLQIPINFTIYGNSSTFHVKVFEDNSLIYENTSYANNTNTKIDRVYSIGVHNITIWVNDTTKGIEETNTTIFTILKIDTSWGNDSWNYRKPITITEQSGNDLTDYQVKLTIDTATLISEGKMNSDCSDIRFYYVNSSGEYKIPYWIESGCNTTNTIIWVKIPNIPASSTVTVYMYYGNPTATSESNGDTVFDFFDDFNDNDLDTNKWTNTSTHGNCYTVVENGYLKLYCPASVSDNIIVESKTSFTNNFKLIYRTYQDCGNNQQCDYFRVGFGYGSFDSEGVWLRTRSTSYSTVARCRSDSCDINIKKGTSLLSSYDTGFKYIVNEYTYEFYYTSSGKLNITVQENNTITVQASDTSYLNNEKTIFLVQGHYSYDNWYMSTFYDFVAVAKYSDSEPTYEIGSEESQADTTPPTIEFVSQTPSDVSSTNILGKYLNITYNITDPSGINASSVKLYYKTNSSTSEIVWYINGTAYYGWQIAENYTNSSSIWYFYLDHQIYPGTYNLPDSVMRDAPKEHFSLDNKNEILKIRFFNVSNNKEFNYLVLDTQNQTASTEFLRIYYCNESYSTGNPENSPYCVEFYDLEPTTPHNYTRDSSLYWIIPLPINKSTGYLANVYVTPTSYILLRDSASVGGWNISYVTNISRPDTVQYSNNNGASYSNFAGTVDMHIHQFSGSDSLWYYVCANDTFGNSNCSEIRQDLIQIDNLPPSSPDVYNPKEGYYRGLITINYTQSISPNAYPIANYTIDLVDLDKNFVQKIADNDLKLSYVWNSSEAPDGKYFIRVRACDNLTQCSYGYSENITIDNTKPFVEIISPQNTTYTTNTITLSFNATDANLNRVWYSLNDGTNITITGSTILILDNGNYKLTLYADDKAGNENSSTVYFKVSVAPAPAPAPAPSEGVVYIPSENETIYFPTLNMTIKFPITIIPKEKMILIIEKDGKILFNQTIEKPTEIELPKGNYTFIFKNDKGDKMVRYLQVNSPTFFEVSIAGKTFKQVEKPSPSIDYALIAKIVIVLGVAYLIYVYWDKIKEKLEEVAWQLKLVK